MELLFKVTEQIIEHLTEEKKVVANSKNYLKCKFEFSEEWQDVTKTAIFTAASGKAFEYILENDACEIPCEVINFPHFTVSVFGGDLITVNSVSVNVLKSGYKKGETPKEPTPDVYTQILKKLTEAEKNIAEAVETAKNLANKVAPSPATVTIYADKWEQDEAELRWHQVVEVVNGTITPRSKVDLQPSVEQLTVFYEKSLAFVTENDNGVITVYCIGQKPENNYTIQASVSEVIV